MGMGKSTAVNVSFNHPNSFYYAGERVAGLVSLRTAHKRLTMKDVFVEFIGEVGYETEPTDNSAASNGHIQTSKHTVYYQISFIDTRYPLIHEKNDENKIILHRGEYSWPFEFTLPKSLPPSTGALKISYPFVKYYIRFVLDKPWYKRSKKQIYPLIIFPHVDISDIHEERHPVVLNHLSRKELRFKICLHHQNILPNEKISLDMSIENPRQLLIKRIEAKLIQYKEINQNHHAEVIFQTNLPKLINNNQAELQETFNLRLPPGRLLSPTCQYTTDCCNSTIRIGIYYELKLEAKVQGLLNGITLSIPLIIGTESLSEQYQLEENNYIETSAADTIVSEDIDVLPSYGSVVEEPESEQFSSL